MYFLATEGWVANMIDSGGFNAVGASFAFVIVLGILSAFVLGLKGFRNFGRTGAPWWVALAYATLFSSIGFFYFKLPGALPGPLCIWAFERGRLHAFRRPTHN